MSLVEPFPFSFQEVSDEKKTTATITQLKPLEWSGALFQITWLSQFAWPTQKENITGSYKVVWPTRKFVTNNNSVPIFLANSLDGQVYLGRNSIVKHSRTIRKILTSTQRTWEDQTWTTSLCSTFLVIFGASCVLWRLKHSRCSSCLLTRAIRRPSVHTKANSQTPDVLIKTLCSTLKTLCSTFWSKIVSSIKISYQWQPFSRSQSLYSDGFTGDHRPD